jgi:hypothetical protein
MTFKSSPPLVTIVSSPASSLREARNKSLPSAFAGKNRGDHKARDEGRRLDYDAKERNAMAPLPTGWLYHMVGIFHIIA